MEDLPQHAHCLEPEESGMQGGENAHVSHQRGVGGGLEKRPNPLRNTVAVRLHANTEGVASHTVHHNCFIGSEFGKYAMTTADVRSFLSITEQCAPCPRLVLCCIGGCMRRMFRGGGVSNNENMLYKNF